MDTPWWRGRTLALVCRALTLGTFMFLVALTARTRHWIHFDCAMYLHTAELILDGRVPYVDFVEINPPLAMYLHVPPVWIARLLGVSVVSVFNTMVTLLAGVGAVALLRHLPRLVPDLSEPHRQLVATFWLGLTFLVSIGGHWVLPSFAAGTDLGQREHLILLGYLPFLLHRAVRYRCPDVRIHPAESIAVGVLAGLVLCLKPHYLVAALLVEGHLAWERKRLAPIRAPEALAAVAVALVYLAHFALLPAAAREAFFVRWLPLTSARYAAYHSPLESVLALETVHIAIVLAIVVWLPWREPHRSMIRRAAPLGTFAFGAALAMVLQHKGWPYHLIPAAAGAYMMLILLAVQVMQHHADGVSDSGGGIVDRAQRLLVGARVPIMILMVSAWMGAVIRNSPQLFDRFRSPSLDLVYRLTDQGDPVLYINTAVYGAYPEAFHARRTPGSRYLWTFPIAYLFHGATPLPNGAPSYAVPVGREAEERQLMDELTEDIRERRPKIVFIWNAIAQGCPPGFSIPMYLKKNGTVEAALGDYYEVPAVGAWSVYIRRDIPLREAKSRAP